MSDDWMNMDDIRAVTAPPQQAIARTFDVTNAQVSVELPLIGGQLPGALTEGIFSVYTAQLEPAPDNPLYVGYDSDDRKGHIRNVLTTLQTANYQPVPFLVIPVEGDFVAVDDQRLPKYHVYTEWDMFYALRMGRIPNALIRIPPVQDIGHLLKMALTSNQIQTPFNPLQKCDVAAKLADVPYRFSQEVIADIIGNDKDFGSQRVSQEVVSRMIQASKQPPIIRDYLANGFLQFTQVYALAVRVKDPATRILMARYAVDQSLTVNKLVAAINEVSPATGSATAELRDTGEHVELIRRSDQTLRLTSDRPARTESYFKTGAMTRRAETWAMNKGAHQHAIVVVPNKNPEAVAVDASSLETLRQWVDDARGTVRVSELEEMLLSVIIATRNALAEEGLLTESGKIAPVVDADQVAKAR